jgi:dTDP-4-dehydrorhamnose reductase
MVDLLIIGKNGQLGSTFVNEAQKRKLHFSAYSHHELDISNSKHLQIILKGKPRIIINTSAYHVLADCERNPHDAFLINTTSVAQLAKIAKEVGATFVTYSTNYVFDGVKKTPYKENDMPNPLQVYGLSKLAGEYAAINEYQKGTYVIRTCGVYGNGKKGSNSKGGNYILKILQEARKSNKILASKKQITNPTYAKHLAIGTLDLLQSKAPPGLYHLANEGEMSWYDFAKAIVSSVGLKTKIVVREDEANYKRPLYTVLGNYKAKKYGVVLPKVSAGLKEYIEELSG